MRQTLRGWLGTTLVLGGIALFVATFVPDDGTTALPLPRQTVSVGTHTFSVDVAQTPAARAHGLMDRATLAPNTGMAFIYPDAQLRQFWMKRTLVPLDILFFDHRRVLIAMQTETPPCRVEPCPIYLSRAAAQYVLELPAGDALASGVQLGDRLSMLSRPHDAHPARMPLAPLSPSLTERR